MGNSANRMNVSVEPTSKDFIWRAEQIAKYRQISRDKLFYDVWFDSFIWGHRKSYEGGVVGFLGNLPEKSEVLTESYARVFRTAGLETLTSIPQAYAVLMDFDDQAFVRHHFFDKFPVHFKKSRIPPAIFVLGRYKGTDSPTGHVLTITSNSPDTVEIKLTDALDASFRLVSGAISMPPSALSANAPYTMFGCHIQFTAIG